MRLEPSERTSLSPERMRTSVMLSPSRWFKPVVQSVCVHVQCAVLFTFHGDDFVVVDIHSWEA
jgi:hypothetical protein